MALVFMSVLEECKGEFMEFGLKILWGSNMENSAMDCLINSSLPSRDLMCTVYHLDCIEQTVTYLVS